MAAPTPATYHRNVGHTGFLTWTAVWGNADQLSEAVVIDLSSLEYTNSLTIKQIDWTCTAGIEFTLLFDATDSDNEPIMSSALGVTNKQGTIEPSKFGLDGIVKTLAGSTGDLLITTTSAASADEIWLAIHYRVD
mgnify:CR=1 FL=1|tara:strand:- start:517 stop:921 length:405 start_codon:yes stop_codon:yes gene_type:complete